MREREDMGQMAAHELLLLASRECGREEKAGQKRLPSCSFFACRECERAHSRLRELLAPSTLTPQSASSTSLSSNNLPHVYVVRYRLQRPTDDPIYFHWGIMLRSPGGAVGRVCHLEGSPGFFRFQIYPQTRPIYMSENHLGDLDLGSSPLLDVSQLIEVIRSVPILNIEDEGWDEFDCRVWVELAVNVLQDYLDLTITSWPSMTP